MKANVFIELDAWRTVRRYVMSSSEECSMLAEVEVKDNTFLITKIYLPRQTRSAAYTKITPEGVAELLSREDVDPAKIKAWFHSHVNMGCSPSCTDKAQAAELMADCEWFICGIFNKKNEYSMYIHWMGMEIEANLEIVFDADYDEEATKKELEDATVASQVITYVNPTIKKGKKKDKHNYANTWKLSYVQHTEQNPYITFPVHTAYEQSMLAQSYANIMSQVDSALIANDDDDIMMVGSELYENYLDDVCNLVITNKEAIEKLKQQWEIIKASPIDWLLNPWKYGTRSYGATSYGVMDE